MIMVCIRDHGADHVMWLPTIGVCIYACELNFAPSNTRSTRSFGLSTIPIGNVRLCVAG